MKNFNIKRDITFMSKEQITLECVDIANSAHFPTDYDDVYSHLFESDEYIRLFIVEEQENKIKGFVVLNLFNGYKDNSVLHCHGIILHPDIQGLGFSKMLINYAIGLTNPDVLTAKTHNPRFFNSFIDTCSNIGYYPNPYYPIPEDILKLVTVNPFLKNANEKLVVVNAYPDEKIQQRHRKTEIDPIFTQLGNNDAQAVVVVLNDQKLDLERPNYVKKITYECVNNND